eukprot:gb/GEZN01003744.1/.p1 GENE.gb/GEZN01003744.1/~~gb/GEZN01003744.1/.p1  ORF type:complete len:536 (+),score=49.16 gb/GEZN01003744.1/:25-1608(+)
MSGLDYLALGDGLAARNRTGQLFELSSVSSLLGLLLALSSGGLVVTRSLRGALSLATTPDKDGPAMPANFMPKNGLKAVLAWPGPVSSRLPPVSAGGPVCIFEPDPPDQNSKSPSMEYATREEGWLYGVTVSGRSGSGTSFLAPSGRAEDIVKGTVCCWPRFLIKARMEEYDDQARKDSGFYREIVSVVMQDGDSHHAYCYFYQASEKKKTREKSPPPPSASRKATDNSPESLLLRTLQKDEVSPSGVFTKEIIDASPSAPALTKQVIVPARPGQASDLLFMVSHFLSPRECQNIIAWADQVGFKLTGQPESDKLAYRKNGLVSIHTKAFAQMLFSRLSPFLPQKINMQELAENTRARSRSSGGSMSKKTDVARLRGLSPQIQVYKYEGLDQYFGPHIDQSNPEGSGFTVYTVLIYLSGHPPDFGNVTHSRDPAGTGHVFNSEGYAGGETVFYSDHKAKTIEVEVAPTVGLVVLHGHGDRCMTHEARPVLQGVKYVLRTDVVYSKGAQVKGTPSYVLPPFIRTSHGG